MTTDAADAWAIEPQPVPRELTPEYEAEPYADPWNSIMERIDPDTIKKLARYVL